LLFTGITLLRSHLQWLYEHLTVTSGNPDLIRAQYRIYSKQIPLLYFIIAVNALAMMHAFATVGHSWLAIYTPAALVGVSLMRALVWWSRSGREVALEVARRRLRNAPVAAALFTLLFGVWGLALHSYGDIYAKGQMVFGLGLTMMASAFCLTHLLPAALAVVTVGLAPYTMYFCFAEGGRYQSMVISLPLVALGLVAAIVRSYHQFASLLDSERALALKQAETMRLANENSRLANRDPLTGLANRRKFIARLTEVCGDAEAGEVAMAFVDLDGFKAVNDDCGHEAGDKVIAHVGKLLAELLPCSALLARLGGDEFAALVAGPRAEAAMLAFATAACAALRSAAPVGVRAARVGASIGVAAATARCDARELLRRADVAMYHVKAGGKDGVRRYEPALDCERRRLARLKDEIRAGLAAQEFEVHYQPIVDAHSGRANAVEALLRWPRRPGGPLGPDEFIPAAEAGGLVDAPGMFALRRACEDWLSLADVAVSVNVSPAQFRDPEFEYKVAAILGHTGFPAARLGLEVTEGYLIDDPERAAEAIANLKALGASVVLDDFGAGYTSIAYLQKYGFSAIKVDRSLVSRIALDEKARVLVTGVVYLANGLDMTVTAEGVETEEQARLLRLAGCQNLQGFHYSEPKPIGELAAELRPGRCAA